MKTKFMSLALVLSLLMGMLTIPVQAAEAQAVTPTDTPYSWTMQGTWSKNLDWFDTNVSFNEDANSLTNDAIRKTTFWLSTSNTTSVDNPKNGVYDVNGLRSLNVFSMRDAITSYSGSALDGTAYDNVEGKHYGLPYRDVNGKKAVEENLRITLENTAAGGKFEPLDTADYAGGAINLAMDYVYHPAQDSMSVAFLKRLEVEVSLDNGETWLGSAGVRSTKLIAGGRYNNVTKGVDCLVFHIETDNLLDIDGVAGNTITDIRIWPDGKDSYAFGDFSMSSLKVNCYGSESDFETAAPADEIEYVDGMDEETMRQIVLREAENTASIEWSVDETYNSGSAYYYPGVTYRGPAYSKTPDTTREVFDAYKDTDRYGMDCQGFAFNAVSRVSRAYAWSVKNTINTARIKMLGDLVTADHPVFTDYDIISYKDPNTGLNANDTYDVFNAYAELQPGDIILNNRGVDDSVHVRIVKSVNVNINPNTGNAYGDSTVTCVEQATTPMYYYDGEFYTISGLENMGLTVADAEYGNSSRFEATYTFSNLYGADYVPFTLTDYEDGQVEKEKVEMIIAPKGDSMVYDGMHISIASNYRLIGYEVSIEDANGDPVFTDGQLILDSHTIGMNYNGAIQYNAATTLDAALASLEEGSYELVVKVQSGPAHELPAAGEQIEVPVTEQRVAFKAFGCGHDHNNDKVLPAAGGALNGNFYLDGDTTAEAVYTIAADAEVTLCLAGHTLTADSGLTGSLFTVSSGGTFNLDNGTAGGTIDGNGNNMRCVLLNGSMTMANGTIQNFKMSGSGNVGGAISVENSSSVLTINGGTLTGNQAYSGGAIRAVRGKTYLSNVEISNNKATSTSYSGGGIYINGSTATVTVNEGTKIFGNSGSGQGGGVCVYSGTLAMNGGEIYSNTSSKSGAGVFLHSNDNAAFTMSGGDIHSNTTSGNYAGAGVRLNGGTFTMSGGAIYSNNNASASYGGGGIYNNGATVTISAGTIGIDSSGNMNPNTAGGDSTVAGAAILGAAGTVEITGGRFVGGMTGTVTVSGGQFSVDPTEFVDTNTYDVVNTGAAITPYSVGVKGSFEADPCGHYHSGDTVLPAAGGALNGTYYLDGDTTAEAVYTIAADAEVTLCLAGHTLTADAGLSGSSLFTVTSKGVFTLDNGTAGGTVDGNNSNNTNLRFLNIPVASGTTSTLKNCTIQNFTSTSDGGAVRVTQSGKLYITDSILQNNTGKTGGAIYVGGTSTKVYLQNTTISGNTTTDGTYGGGGIRVNDTGSSSIVSIDENTVISGNISAANGGGVQVCAGNFEMNGGIIKNNTANGSTGGGGIYVRTANGTVTMNNGYIYGNTAKYGAAVRIYNGSFTMKAGAVGIDESGTTVQNILLTDGSYSGVYANNEGAITISGGRVVGGNGLADNMTISGGEFSIKPDAAALESGYSVTNNGTGDTPYKVEEVVLEACGHDHRSDTVLPAAGGALTGGSYYLTENTTAAASYTIDGATVNLCLKGFTLTAGDGVSGNLFAMENSASLVMENTLLGGTVDGNGKSIRFANMVGSSMNLTNITVQNFVGTVDGVFRNTGSNKTSTITGCTLQNNKGKTGIVYVPSSTYNIVNSTITGNISTTGGAIYSNGGTVTLQNCEIYGNEASTTTDATTTYNSGGAIYVNGEGTVNVDGGTKIYSNTADNGGGAYVNNGTLNLKNGFIYSNEAKTSGGGIYSNDKVNVTGGAIGLNANGEKAENIAPSYSAINAAKGTSTISGGRIYGDYQKVGALTVTGGQFSSDPTGYYDANTYTVNVDGTSITPYEVVEAADSVVTIFARNMSLGNSLAINYYFEVPAADTDLTGYTATITQTRPEGVEAKAPVVVDLSGKTPVLKDDKYVVEVTVSGLAAKEMADTFTIVVSKTGVKNVSQVDSIRTYAMDTLADTTDDKVKTLMVDMLNYGAQAQTYFGYNADDLANKDLTVEQQAFATASVTCESNGALLEGEASGYRGTVLSLKENTIMKMLFRNTCVSEGMVATITYTPHYENAELVTKNVTISSEHLNGTNYEITVADLVVADGETMVTCTIKDGDETVISVQDSIESYVARNATTDVADLGDALMKFSTAAYNYLHSTN